jgi:hypothetical protein
MAAQSESKSSRLGVSACVSACKRTGHSFTLCITTDICTPVLIAGAAVCACCCCLMQRVQTFFRSRGSSTPWAVHHHASNPVQMYCPPHFNLQSKTFHPPPTPSDALHTKVLCG